MKALLLLLASCAAISPDEFHASYSDGGMNGDIDRLGVNQAFWATTFGFTWYLEDPPETPWTLSARTEHVCPTPEPVTVEVPVEVPTEDPVWPEVLITAITTLGLLLGGQRIKAAREAA